LRHNLDFTAGSRLGQPARGNVDIIPN
jgi:hypothetical protein